MLKGNFLVEIKKFRIFSETPQTGEVPCSYGSI